MSPTSDFKIAIIGAGPAGLTLASLLTASTYPFNFTVFEKRPRPSPSGVDDFSGNLDLQEGLGLDAIKACGLYEPFMKCEGVCTQQTKTVDKNGNVLTDSIGDGRPGIPRSTLIELLCSSIPDNRFRWDTTVVGVRPADGQVGEKGTIEIRENKASTSETRTEAYDLIVGADGAWSTARAAIPAAPRPVYSGICWLACYYPPLPEAYPDLDNMIGEGTFAIVGDSKLVLTQRGLQGTAQLCFFLHSKCQEATRNELQSQCQCQRHGNEVGPNPMLSPDRLLSSIPDNYKDLKRVFLANDDFFGTHSEETKRLLSVAFENQPADAKVDARQLDMLPLSPCPHPHTRGIALIGDAAHLMTPFAGKCVNIAMADSLSLVEQLERVVAEPSGAGILEDRLDAALLDYEKTVHPRGKEAMDLTWANLGLSFGETGPDVFGNLLLTS